MKLILLSGGSGKRLWPLSNDARSKQFLKVLRNERGELQSMVQRVWSQLESTGLIESSYIATSKSQIEMIQNQLGTDVRIIVEPERRDTFPAISLSCTYLYSVEDVGLDEVIVVLPVDPYVDNHFFEMVKNLDNILQNNQSDLALIGVVPTYPSEKYGYIVPKTGQGGKEYLNVSHFKEKPTEKQAKELISQQAMWNSGVFAFKLRFMINKISELGFSTDYKVLKKKYGELPKISFDYQVVEKTKNIIALSYNGSWKDLGTWNTITEEMSSETHGNGIISRDSHNAHIVNELDIPVSVLGLSNIVVAASLDGILVTDKNASPRVKELVENINLRPMFEERRWGWYKVLEYTKSTSGEEVLTKHIKIKGGKNLSYQMHNMRSEVWTIVSGKGEVALNGAIYSVKQGDIISIPAETKHAIRAIMDMEIIEVQIGKELIEEDIVRLLMLWEEIEKHCVKCSSLEEPSYFKKLYLTP